MQNDKTTKKRTRRFRLVAVALSCLLTGVVGEIVCRVFFGRLHDTTLLSGQLDTTNIKGLIDAEDDPLIMYGLRRGISTMFCGTRVDTDGVGARIDATAPPERGDSLRVALLGDSTSFGWRVDHRETFGEKARAVLEAALGRGVVLRNYSVPGYNAGQEARTFETKVLAFRPHLLIVHHDPNDSQPLGWGYDLWLPATFGDNPLHSALIKTVVRQIRKLGMRKTPGEDPSNKFLEGHCISGPLYDAMLQQRRTLVDKASASGIPSVIVLFHSGLSAGSDPATDPIYIHMHKDPTAQFAGMGYLVLDLYPHLKRLMTEKGISDMKSYWCAPDDPHPNAVLHEFIGRALGEFVLNDPGLRAALSK